MNRLTDGLDIGRGELDPLAMHIALDQDGYANMLVDMAKQAKQCLSATLSVESEPKVAE